MPIMKLTDKDREYAAKVRPQMDWLAAEIGTYVETDLCGEPCIKGRNGSIHADGPDGWVCYLEFPSNPSLNMAISRLGTTISVKQHGDRELTFRIEKDPFSALFVRYLKPRKKRVMSVEQRAATSERLRLARARKAIKD